MVRVRAWHASRRRCRAGVARGCPAALCAGEGTQVTPLSRTPVRIQGRKERILRLDEVALRKSESASSR